MTMRKIGNKAEPIEVVGLSRLEATLAIIDKKLLAHGYKVRHDWISARLLVLRNILLALGGLAVFLILAAVLLKEITKETTTIEAFDVAADLDKDGLSPRVLAKMLYDEMVRIQTVASASVNRKTIAPSAWKLDNSLTIPETKLTLGAFFTYARGQLGLQSQTIDGELVRMGEKLQLRVRVRGKPHAVFAGSREKLDDLLRQAAEHVYITIEPLVLSIARRNSGDFQGAVEAAKRAASSTDPEEAAAGLAEWGNGLSRQGHWTSAYERYKEAIRLKHSNAAAYEGMRTIVGRLGKRDEFKASLQAIAKLEPRFVQAPTFLAELAYTEGDFSTSASYASRAVALEPDYPAAWYYLLQYKLEIEHDALHVLDKATSLLKSARNSPYTVALGAAMQLVSQAQIDLRDYEAAQATIQDYIQERPGDFRGYVRLAQLHLETREYQKAVLAMREAKRLGVDVSAYYDVVAKSRAESLQSAEQEAKEQLSQRARYFRVIGALAEAYLYHGEAQKAAEQYKLATEIAPSWPSAWLGLGIANLALNDLTSARQNAMKASTIAPKWSAPHVLLGDVALAQNDSKTAVQEYQVAIKLDPKWGEPYFKWGKLLQTQGDESGAKEKFAMAFKLEPFNEEYKKLGDAQR